MTDDAHGMMIEIQPLSRALAASVNGVDLNEPIDDKNFDLLHQAFLEHLVLIFPGQHLRPAGQMAFARRWGPPMVVPYLAAHALPEHPSLLQVTNMGKANTLTENWHFDSAFFPQPPAITILAAQMLPAVGGDTMWANQYLAYEALSDGMKALASGLRARFCGTRVAEDQTRQPYVTVHPIVRVHPETGRQALGVGRPGESVSGFEGMSDEESRPLLGYLYEHASRPEFLYRHRWSPGDVVMWDNRCTMHYAVHDYGDEERTLNRVTVNGIPP
jgi:taurine dioxygenase